MGKYIFMTTAAFIACAKAFQCPFHSTSLCQRQRTLTLYSSSTVPSGTGFAKNDPETSKETQNNAINLSSMKTPEIKLLLLDLLPRMKGTNEEFRLVEAYVNALEDSYVPPQTLDFLNLAMTGEWQFLFTTNQLKRPSLSLRLTELTQKLESNGLKGKIINQASWALAEDGMGMRFDANGQFSASISYNINQGARVTFSEDHDLAVNLAKGSSVPQDVEGLVGLIHRAMPSEMFDPSGLAMDTTFLDPDLRIVRFTGSRHEGVRNIFIRKGAIEINPNL
jgi:DNA-directed RNA polymerase subunit F